MDAALSALLDVILIVPDAAPDAAPSASYVQPLWGTKAANGLMGFYSVDVAFWELRPTKPGVGGQRFGAVERFGRSSTPGGQGGRVGGGGNIEHILLLAHPDPDLIFAEPEWLESSYVQNQLPCRIWQDGGRLSLDVAHQKLRPRGRTPLGDTGGARLAFAGRSSRTELRPDLRPVEPKRRPAAPTELRPRPVHGFPPPIAHSSH